MKATALPLLLSLCALGTFPAAQNTFDLDRTITPALFPPGLLTEGFPTPPVGALPDFVLGLGPGDEIDALSFGDDAAILNDHVLVFSVDPTTMGMPGTGVDFEFTMDTAPGTPPAAAGDLFLQDLVVAPGNVLAPPGMGYDAGSFTGDEANAAWASPCGPAGGCEDLDAFDDSPPALAAGVYFSLRPGSPTLAALGATAGAILYSDLSGAPPVIATLAGAGPATAANLGIAGMDLDALNVWGSVGPVAAGGGVIFPGPVGSSPAGPAPPSTHLVEYSVALGTGIDADVLVRTGPGIFAVHTPAPLLGLFPHENLNALEAHPLPSCPSLPATVFGYNGSGINLDAFSATKVVIGGSWVATLAPQSARGPGGWVILLRTSSSAGPVVDLGVLLGLPPAGLSELLVGGGALATFTAPPHGGGGTVSTFAAPVPFSCPLVGLPWFAQGVVTGDLPAGLGVLDPWFSSAAGGIVGTF